jgi:hypothetical protein
MIQPLEIQLKTVSAVYDAKKSSLVSVSCSNQHEVLGFAIIATDYLIVASGSADVKVCLSRIRIGKNNFC